MRTDLPVLDGGRGRRGGLRGDPQRTVAALAFGRQADRRGEDVAFDLAAEEPASALPALLQVLNLTVTGVTVADTADLILGFEGGVTLQVSGTQSAWTTHDVWWLGDPHA